MPLDFVNNNNNNIQLRNMRLSLQLLAAVRRAPVCTSNSLNHSRFLSSTTRRSNTKKETRENPGSSSNKQTNSPASDPGSNNGQQPAKDKSVAQADEELRERLEQMSGEGGASGIEYEDGRPNTMKRSVRNNMFRIFDAIITVPVSI